MLSLQTLFASFFFVFFLLRESNAHWFVFRSSQCGISPLTNNTFLLTEWWWPYKGFGNAHSIHHPHTAWSVFRKDFVLNICKEYIQAQSGPLTGISLCTRQTISLFIPFLQLTDRSRDRQPFWGVFLVVRWPIHAVAVSFLFFDAALCSLSNDVIWLDSKWWQVSLNRWTEKSLLFFQGWFGRCYIEYRRVVTCPLWAH